MCSGLGPGESVSGTGDDAAALATRLLAPRAPRVAGAPGDGGGEGGAARLLYEAACLWLREQRRRTRTPPAEDIDGAVSADKEGKTGAAANRSVSSQSSFAQLRSAISTTAKALAEDIVPNVLGTIVGDTSIPAGSSAWPAQCSWETCDDLLPALERAHKCLRKRPRADFERLCVKVVDSIVDYTVNNADFSPTKSLIEALVRAHESSLKHYSSAKDKASAQFNLLSWLCYNFPIDDLVRVAVPSDDDSFDACASESSRSRSRSERMETP